MVLCIGVVRVDILHSAARGKPCFRCGSTERYQSGQCIPCARNAKTVEGKPCRACGGTLKSAANNKCLPCRRKAARNFQRKNYGTNGTNLHRQLGVTFAEVEQMKEEQGWACKICGRVPEKTLHLDHCHKTMKVRGLLCRPCNKALGFFEDDIERLKNAVEYLNANDAVC